MNILITGASGGIGRHLTEHFDKPGNALFLTYRTYQSHLRNVAIPAAASAEMIIMCDFTKSADVQALFDRIRSLDVIVNCMGHVENSLAVRMDEEQWDRVIDSNLKTVFLSCKHGAPLMAPCGHIVNISSVLGSLGMPGASNYCAAKGAVEAFTRAFALECIPRGIFVNAIALGYFKTGLGLELSPKSVEAALSRIPLRRFGEPGEISRAVDYVIASRYMTGSVLHLNGGLWNS